MGLFTPNYNKPGKGVDKNAPEKRRLWLFFEIFWNQSSKLILANILYSIAMLPLMIGIMLCFEVNFESPSIIAFRDGKIDLLGLILLVISLFTSFPATIGFTYILRNIQRREHAWIWHDFMKHTRLNYLKGVVNGIVTLLGYIIFVTAYGIYRSGILNIGMLSAYLSGVMLVTIVVFTWMQFYVNTMIVTFDLKLGSIYKNAFIFALGRLPVNLLISVICIVLMYLILLFPIPFITFLLSFIIWYVLFGFIVVFSVYPSIDKHMISKAEKKTDDDEN